MLKPDKDLGEQYSAKACAPLLLATALVTAAAV
jgi:hypothetical protein